MKTTNNKALVATVAVSVIALIAVTKLAASFVPAIVIAGAYVAVGVLFAVAAVDYRLGKTIRPAKGGANFKSVS